jgi:hypothetical protein
MPPKLRFIRRLFFCTLLDSWILIGIGSPEREEERGSTDTGGRNEGSVTRSSERLNSTFTRSRDSTQCLRDLVKDSTQHLIRRGVYFVSFFNELDTENELCSWLSMFHFLMSLTQKKNYAHNPLFHFLTSLTQKRTLLIILCFIF